MGTYPADSYPEEKTHNQGKYTYVPYLVVPRPANIVKCGTDGRELESARASPKRTLLIVDPRPSILRRQVDPARELIS
jgi:hypothetical protein